MTSSQRIRTITPPRPRRAPRRPPFAATVALYAVGLTIGFLLAALASAPGGTGVVSIQLGGAAVAAIVAAVAALVARKRVVRNRPRLVPVGATQRPYPAEAPPSVRRLARAA